LANFFTVASLPRSAIGILYNRGLIVSSCPINAPALPRGPKVLGALRLDNLAACTAEDGPVAAGAAGGGGACTGAGLGGGGAGALGALKHIL